MQDQVGVEEKSVLPGPDARLPCSGLLWRKRDAFDVSPAHPLPSRALPALLLFRGGHASNAVVAQTQSFAASLSCGHPVKLRSPQGWLRRWCVLDLEAGALVVYKLEKQSFKDSSSVRRKRSLTDTAAVQKAALTSPLSRFRSAAKRGRVSSGQGPAGFPVVLDSLPLAGRPRATLVEALPLQVLLRPRCVQCRSHLHSGLLRP